MRFARSFSGRRSVFWLAPLAVVVANLVWLSAFGSGSRVRQRELDRRLKAAQQAQGDLAKRLAARERLWIRATENRERLERLRTERFSTELARFTAQVRELKDLATRAGLDPQAIAYPQDQLLDYGLVRRSFVFSVQGGYDALRNFLHLLELSESFLTVEQIGVSESRGELSIKLRLSTLFEAVTSDAEAERLGESSREPGAAAPAPPAPETGGES